MRRVLVTGGHGFVGSHLLDLLQARGDRVRCLHRRPRLPAALEGRDVEIAHGDVRDPEALARALDGVEEVYHLAGLTRSLTRSEIVRTNAGGTWNLLRAAARAGLPGRFVYCSSLAAVGPAADGRPQDESAPCRPVTWYGESKLLGERAVARFADRLRTTVVRPPAVYGPRDHDFLPVFRAATRGLLPVLGDHPRHYNFIYAPELAAAILALAAEPAAVGRTYFVGHGEILTAEQFAEHAARAVGRRTRRLHVPESALALMSRGGDLISQLTGRVTLLNGQRLRELSGRAYVACAARLERDTGFRAQVGAAEGCTMTAAWYREHGWL